MRPFRSTSNARRVPRSSTQGSTQGSSASHPLDWHAERDQFIMTFPRHPLPSMQAPFEESMLDATGETAYVPFSIPLKKIEERQALLCRHDEHGEASELAWNFTYNCHWRHNPRGKFHPLLKTQAQVVFAVHLLHQHLEKSVADVADIMLKHVHELDRFLRRANEDIEASLKDMLFRRMCLKMPMEHINEFDRLLDDRTYRAQLLDGNIIIERTINRMSILLNDYMVDLSTFQNANREFTQYLQNIGYPWAEINSDVSKIYYAMCGNTSGWAQFLQSVGSKADTLGVVLEQVSSYCNEIEKRCGAASRRSLVASRSSSRSTNSREAARSFRNFSDQKPLPMVPNERPPFMPSASPSGEQASEQSVSPRQQSTRPNPTQVREVPGSSLDALRSNTPAPWANESSQASSGNAPVSNDTMVPRDDLRTDTVTHKQTPFLRGGGIGEHSPPLTGKDSAYSSLSGSSFASPTSLPRSSSAQGSYPRAQFGLFPSSNPGTPKGSVSNRHGTGATSPGLTRAASPPPATTEKQAACHHDQLRSQSAFDNYSSPSAPRRLLKKGSLSSLKRLFTKKKQTGVDSIAE